MAYKIKILSVSGIHITKHLQPRSYQKVTETYLQSENYVSNMEMSQDK